MRDYTQLSRRGHIRRLRALAERALAQYDLEPVDISLLGHLYNTTFAVRGADGSRYVLRIQRAGESPTDSARRRARTESELWWLERLRDDLGLAVPQAVRTRDGRGAVEVAAEGVPEPRVCVLFRRIDGRFLHHRLMPAHLAEVGRVTALMHEHSTHLQVPAWFERPRVDEADAETEESLVRLFTDGWSADAGRIVGAVLRRVRETQEALGAGPGTFGLIHADIHQENYLFGDGELRLIDFDDCGWGHYPYDLAVTIHNMDYLPRGAALRAALLAGYRTVRPLPSEHEAAIHVLYALREAQITTWFLRERDNPSFPTWRDHVGWGVAILERFLTGEG
jgi:Ser/Thr protein kinase RdoA (MazF antagonist)